MRHRDRPATAIGHWSPLPSVRGWKPSANCRPFPDRARRTTVDRRDVPLPARSAAREIHRDWRSAPTDNEDEHATPGQSDTWMGSRSEEHTSELQSLMRNSYAVFCLKKKKNHTNIKHTK